MRFIDTIVVHHSATPRDMDGEKAAKSFNDNHYKRLHLPYQQEVGKRKGKEHIAYHYLIDYSWKIIPCREHELVGFHASNIDINKRSIWVCFIWNFDNETPTAEQYAAGRSLIKDLQNKFMIATIAEHNEFANKTCPWKNFDIDQILNHSKYSHLLETTIAKGYKPQFDKHRGTEPLSEQETKELIDIAISRLLKDPQLVSSLKILLNKEGNEKAKK